MSEKHDKPVSPIFMIMAAAIVIPIGWWIKSSIPLAEWLRVFFTGSP